MKLMMLCQIIINLMWFVTGSESDSDSGQSSQWMEPPNSASRGPSIRPPGSSLDSREPSSLDSWDSSEEPLPLNATQPLVACDTVKDCRVEIAELRLQRLCPRRLCRSMTFCDTVPKKDQKKPKEEVTVLGEQKKPKEEVTALGKQKAFRSGPGELEPSYFQMKKGVCNDKKDCTKTEDCTTVLEKTNTEYDETNDSLLFKTYTAPRKCQDGKCVWTGEVKLNTRTRKRLDNEIIG